MPGTIPRVSIVADSAEATGLKWAAPAGGGKVLQVVQGTTTTTVSTSNSATFFDTNLTASITPSSSTSKVLILVSQTFRMLGNFYTGYQLLRGTTVIYGPNSLHGPTNGVTGNVFDESTTIVYLDSPATTSSTTYKTQIQQTDGATTSQSRSFSTIVLLEIGA